MWSARAAHVPELHRCRAPAAARPIWEEFIRKGLKMPGNFERKLRVLIVSEFEQIQKLVREMLTALGLREVETVSGAADGFDRLRASQRYDLVIADHEMQVVTGLDLLTLMRNDASLKNIRFLLMTDGLSQSEVEALDDAGEVYLLKPFNILGLKSALIAALMAG
jgi:two-component system chemotaxis response regulator CheY